MSETTNYTVFDMEPDDVVLIGGVGDLKTGEEASAKVKELWPQREVFVFANDIDVRLLPLTLIRQAISDPGSFTDRVQIAPDAMETVAGWATRAVAQVLRDYVAEARPIGGSS